MSIIAKLVERINNEPLDITVVCTDGEVMASRFQVSLFAQGKGNAWRFDGSIAEFKHELARRRNQFENLLYTRAAK